MCKCLGKEFLPYLPTCMPQLLESAAKEPSIRVRDLEDDIEDDDDIEAIEASERYMEWWIVHRIVPCSALCDGQCSALCGGQCRAW